MMKNGKMFKAGDVVLVRIHFTDTYETKTRPAVVLFEEFGNVVVAGITSNPNMKGVLLTAEEGAVKDSVIKLNYIFTISSTMISKVLFQLSLEKKRMIFKELMDRLDGLND